MTRKRKVLLALAQEVVALYGKTAQSSEAPACVCDPCRQVSPPIDEHSTISHPTRRLTVSEMHDGRGAVPLLRLQGRWVARAGFPAGTRVVVQVQQGKIVILRSEHESDN